MSKKIDINPYPHDSELWVETYKPTKLANFMGNTKNIEKIKHWMDGFKNKDPEFKPILLLVGAPGTGKTTLAHIVLNEHKYNVIEINASTLEGKSDIHKRFDNITCRGIDVIYSNRVKTGVILDEVDGMAQNEDTMREFINIVDPKNPESKSKSKAKPRGRPPKVVTKMGIVGGKDKGQKKKHVVNVGTISNDIKKKSDGKSGGKSGVKSGGRSGGKSGGKCDAEDDKKGLIRKELTKEDLLIMEFDKQKKEASLARTAFPYQYPVICTANRLSDNRMKILCKHALVVKMEPPTRQILSKLANKIIKREKLNMTANAFALLIERSNSDFRQLISNLQLMSSQKEIIDVADVEILVRGRDTDQNLFDIIDTLMYQKNSIEDIILLSESESRAVSNTIYHNIINIIDVNRLGKKKKKINVISQIMESLAEGQRYNSFVYNASMPVNITKNIVDPVLLSYQMKITNKRPIMQSCNIMNYRSQESRNYINYVSYFIDKFGTFDTKTIFQMCYIIISSLSLMVAEKRYVITTDVDINRGLNLMKQYDLTSDDIEKMLKICAVADDFATLQSKVNMPRFKNFVKKNIGQ